jgi:FlaG/FlaF family flagellin (archaellin)
VTDGAVKSAVRVNPVAAVLLLPAVSVALAASTSTVTLPSALGVTSKV